MKHDKEILDFIESLPKNLTYVEKLNMIIQWQKDNRGMIGYHISVYPKDGSKSAEDIAKEMIDIIVVMASNKCKEVDITGIPL